MTRDPKPVLTGAQVVLRDAGDADKAARLALGNTPEIQAMFGADPRQIRPLTEEAAASWVQSVAEDSFAWMIEADGALLGSIRLHSINYADKRANIAVGILNARALGRGLGTDAVRTLARHAFEDIGLHRLTCRVLAFNDRAAAAYKKVGFVQEGRERESALIGETWHDDLILGLLPDDLTADP